MGHASWGTGPTRFKPEWKEVLSMRDIPPSHVKFRRKQCARGTC